VGARKDAAAEATGGALRVIVKNEGMGLLVG